MTESDVRVIAGQMLNLYEEKTGAPRHDVNTQKFDAIFEVLNKIKGAFIAFTLIIGVPGSIASILVIVSKIRGH